MPTDQPPAGAISLCDFFSLDTADPRLRAAQQQAEERLKTAKAAIPRDSLEIQAANEAFQQAAHAVTNELRNRLLTGEWLAWGREGSPVGPWRLLPADAWQYLKIETDVPHPDFFIITNVVTVPTPPPRKL